MRRRRLLTAAAGLGVSVSISDLVTAAPAAAVDEFMPADKVFSAELTLVDRSHLVLALTAKPGHGIYRDRLVVESAAEGLRVLKVQQGAPAPGTSPDVAKPGQYRGRTLVDVMVDWDESAPLQLTVSLQGCADRGLCYPPLRLRVRVPMAPV